MSWKTKNCYVEAVLTTSWKTRNVCWENTSDGYFCQTSDLWQQLELASELESDLRDTVDWGRNWFVDFNAGKTRLVSFDRSNNTGAIDVRMDGSVLEEKSSFKMLGSSTIRPCMEYCCHVSAGAPSFYLELLVLLRCWYY